MEIEVIRKRIRDGRYLIKNHAVLHALKEGFGRIHMLEAVLSGAIIENYLGESRALICGTTRLSPTVNIYLHVVCEICRSCLH